MITIYWRITKVLINFPSLTGPVCLPERPPTPRFPTRLALGWLSPSNLLSRSLQS